MDRPTAPAHSSDRQSARDAYVSDPKLRAQTERILSMPIEDRIRQLEEEANFFLSVRPLDTNES